MSTPAARVTGRIAFQGEPGAYSHQACREARPGMEAMPCATFEDAIEAVRKGEADLAMLPVENSTYGRVADMHHLLPESGLHIIDEAFVRVHINLLALPGSRIPVANEDRLKAEKPDRVVILPWNIETEIRSQLSYITDWGGKFVTAVPRLKES